MFTAAGKTARPQRAKVGEGSRGIHPEVTVTHSARVPASLNRAIKELALEEDTSLQALTDEALRDLIKKRNKHTN